MTEKMIVTCPECRTRFVAPLEKFLPSGRKVRCAKCGHSWFQQAEVAKDSPPAEETTSAPTPPEQEKTEPRRSTIEEMVARKEAQAAEPVLPRPPSEEDGPKTISPATNGLDETNRMSEALAGSSYDPDARQAVPVPSRTGGWLRPVLYSLAGLIVAGALGYFMREPLSRQFPSLSAPLSSFSDRVDRIVGTVVPSDSPLKIENFTYDLTDIENGKAMLLTADVVNETETAVDAPKLVIKAFGAGDDILHEATMAPEDMSTQIAGNSRTGYFLRIPHPPEGIKRVKVDFAEES